MDDGEGELLAGIRAVAPTLPIAVGLDFHAHMTAPMVDNATVIAGYCTYPHVDMGATAAARRANAPARARGRDCPRHGLGLAPDDDEHAPAHAIAAAHEGHHGHGDGRGGGGAVLNASVFGGFPHADIPHISCSAVIVCDRRTDEGQALLDRLLGMAWDRRAAFLYEGAPLASQIAHARTLGDGPSCSWTTATTPRPAARRT